MQQDEIDNEIEVAKTPNAPQHDQPAYGGLFCAETNIRRFDLLICKNSVLSLGVYWGEQRRQCRRNEIKVMAETPDTPRHNKTAVRGGHLAVDRRILDDSMS